MKIQFLNQSRFTRHRSAGFQPAVSQGFQPADAPKLQPRLKYSCLLAIGAFICAAVTLALPRSAAAITLYSPLDRDAADAAAGGSGSLPKSIRIQVVESGSQAAAKDVAWLGVSTEEASNALSAQLGMQPGDGLVVAFVQPDSPAAKAGLQKNDVLVEMGDQLLLHPGQFRKLVRRQKEGDKVQLTLFRGGKKLSLSATLAKTTERAGNLEDATHEFQVQVKEPKLSDTVRDSMVPWRSVRPYAGLFRQVAHVEDQRDIEEAREALNAALLRNRSFALALGPEAVKVQQWTKGNLAPSQTTTITLTKNAKSSRTFVKADETGTYVIMAGPTKHLTIHDKEGTVLFDGDIETPAQQQKVPAGFWQKAQLMLEEMNSAPEDETRPKASPSDKEKK